MRRSITGGGREISVSISAGRTGEPTEPREAVSRAKHSFSSATVFRTRLARVKESKKRDRQTTSKKFTVLPLSPTRREGIYLTRTRGGEGGRALIYTLYIVFKV